MVVCERESTSEVLGGDACLCMCFPLCEYFFMHLYF